MEREYRICVDSNSHCNKITHSVPCDWSRHPPMAMACQLALSMDMIINGLWPACHNSVLTSPIKASRHLKLANEASLSSVAARWRGALATCDLLSFELERLEFRNLVCLCSLLAE